MGTVFAMVGSGFFDEVASVPIPHNSLWALTDGDPAVPVSVAMSAMGSRRLLWQAVYADPLSRVQVHRRVYGHQGAIGSDVVSRVTLESLGTQTVFADAVEVADDQVASAVAVACDPSSGGSTALVWPRAGRDVETTVWSLLVATWTLSREGLDERSPFTLLALLIAEVLSAGHSIWIPAQVVETAQVGGAIFGPPESLQRAANAFEQRFDRIQDLTEAWGQGLVLSMTR
jgi:hypothetical protein